MIQWLTDNAVWLGAVGAIAAVLALLWAIWSFFKSRSNPPNLPQQTATVTGSGSKLVQKTKTASQTADISGKNNDVTQEQS